VQVQRISVSVTVCVLLALALCPHVFSVEGPQQVQMTAHDACQRLGVGINLGNMLEAPTEGAWGVRFEDHYAAKIREAGFSHVRLPVKWSIHADDAAPFRIDRKFLARVKHVVDQCLKQDLVVVLNVHHFDEMHSAPDENEPRLQVIWQQIGDEFANASPSLYFELLNEPHRNLTTDRWNEMVPGLLSVVRRKHPQRPVIIGGGSWNNHSELKNLRLPENDRMLIVTFHYYFPFPFTHQGASWTAPNIPPLGRRFPADDVEQRTMAKDFAGAREWSTMHDRPLYVGEYGSYSAADLKDRIRWTKYVRKLLDENGFSSAYWEFCSGFGAYDPKTDQWRSGILNALISDSPSSGR
jgi:endoglucanase